MEVLVSTSRDNVLSTLNANARGLLMDVLALRAPDLAHALTANPTLRTSRKDVDRMIAAVMNEFSATGLQPDFEPNARGLQLEDLRDQIESLGLPAGVSVGGDWAFRNTAFGR